MATWRFIGSITPDRNRRFLDTLSSCNFYKIIVADCPLLTKSHLILEAWANQKPIGQLTRPIEPEQVFEWLEPCERIISIRLGKPLKSTEEHPQIQVGLYEWQVDPPKPDPDLNLWLPGNH